MTDRVEELADSVRAAEANGWPWEIVTIASRGTLPIHRDDGVQTSFFGAKAVVQDATLAG
ncbi:MAG: hypothetical protein KF901_32000 [Myxococcales bacterium]|nr:hypothetical protein [Myxococcales bacterium]